MSDLAPFGREQTWLAVRGQPQVGVVEALGLTGGRVAEVDEAVRESVGAATAVLPPLQGVGGAWTLVVGQDVRRPSAARITTLSAMLGTGVQLFALADDGTRHCLLAERGRVEHELHVPGDELGDLAADWSIDPTTLGGPAPGSALLVAALRAEPPTPENDPTLPVVRHDGLLSRLFGR